MGDKKSLELFERGCKVIPGGVNSPVRACRSVGMTPLFMDRSEGCYLYDADGREYIDLICSWGPMILGHNDARIREAVMGACEKGLSFGCPTGLEVEIAEYICQRVPHVEMIRMVNSGTEAVMSAIRTARGFTGRNKIVKFTGCYHGHTDAMLISAGSGVMTARASDSAGVPDGCVADTLLAAYNNLDSVQALFAESAHLSQKDQIAAVIVEPVAANMGVVLPEPGFLEGLRHLCTEYGALLIFDEVITGFRLGFTGAAGYYQIKPDLVTYGKIIGGGMPVGAYGGRKDIMEMVAPLGSVYQAGTLSGNPIAMTAGLAQLKLLYENPQIYERLAAAGEILYGGIKKFSQEKGLPWQINYVGSLGCLFFADAPVRDYDSAKRSDPEKYRKYYQSMRERGIHLAPSQFEAMFLSAAHTEEILERILQAARESLS